VGEFVFRQGKLLAKPKELREFRILVPEIVPMQADGLVSFADLEGLTYKIDQARQALSLTVPPNRLMSTVLEASPGNCTARSRAGQARH